MTKPIFVRLSSYDLPATMPEQAAKVEEEWQELQEAYRCFTLAQAVEPNLEHLGEEIFDLFEALHRYGRKAGINMTRANIRHLSKMYARHGRVDDVPTEET